MHATKSEVFHDVSSFCVFRTQHTWLLASVYTYIKSRNTQYAVMQQNLDKILKPKFKSICTEDSSQKHDKVSKTVEKHSSNLLRLLSSHTRVKRKGDASDLPVADGSRKESGGVSEAAAVFPTGIQMESPVTQEAFKVIDGQERRRCPLCGNLFVVSSGEYDDHFHAELVALADQDLETWDNWSKSDSLGASNALYDAPRVYVLGGLPSHAVPKDPKKFRSSAIKLQQIKRSPSVPAANHYADGGGLLGGEELGIDGHNTAGLKWEGMGASYDL